jgi:hypothetical protein
MQIFKTNKILSYINGLLASRGSTAAEHSPHHPKDKGLSQTAAASSQREKFQFFNLNHCLKAYYQILFRIY